MAMQKGSKIDRSEKKEYALMVVKPGGDEVQFAVADPEDEEQRKWIIDMVKRLGVTNCRLLERVEVTTVRSIINDITESVDFDDPSGS